MKRMFVIFLICFIGMAMVAQSDAGVYPDTQLNLLAAVTGESTANASYLAYAAKAAEEGYPVVALVFRATAAAELKHADDEFAILVSYDSTATRPTIAPQVAGDIATNLTAAINGETAESNDMYPRFVTSADAEGETVARSFFNRTGKVEGHHAGMFSDILTNISDSTYLGTTYGIVYRCPTCGEILLSNTSACPMCFAPAASFVQYVLFSATILNLKDAVAGETQANKNYLAFADKAEAEGHKEIAKIFRAIADAEAKHANDEFDILSRLDSTAVKPTPTTPTPGTTSENLTAAIAGETDETQVMYPAFRAEAAFEGMLEAEDIFYDAGRAEGVHAVIYADLLTNINNKSYIKSKYETIYRCPECGNILLSNGADCNLCGHAKANFAEYKIVDDTTGCNIGYMFFALGIIPFVIMRRG